MLTLDLDKKLFSSDFLPSATKKHLWSARMVRDFGRKHFVITAQPLWLKSWELCILFYSPAIVIYVCAKRNQHATKTIKKEIPFHSNWQEPRAHVLHMSSFQRQRIVLKTKTKKHIKKNAGIRLCFLHYNVDSVNMVTCCKHWCQIAKTFLGQNATCSGPSDSAACPAASQIRHQHLVKVLLLVARKIACCSQMITDERWRK